MHRIECPNCGHEHTAFFDSDGLAECPQCGVTLALGGSLGMDHDFVTEFEDCVAETYKLVEEAKNLDDASLEDEIAFELATNDYMKGTFGIVAEMETTGKLAYDTRKMAEGVYILMHSKKYFGWEQ